MTDAQVLRREEPLRGVTVLTLDRPRRRNALAPSLTAALHRAIDDIAADPACRVVVITGAPPAFCSGVDMKVAAGDASDDGSGSVVGDLRRKVSSDLARHLATQEHLAELVEKIHRLRQPVIAAVNGPATGGGFALALASDIRVAAPTASFCAAFIKRGVSACDMGTSYLLPRLVGASRSAELLLTGRTMEANEALAIGLVTSIVPEDGLLDAAVEIAKVIAQHAPIAVWMTKETMWQTLDAPSLRHAIDFENRTQLMCLSNGELAEAFGAFAAKNEPKWEPL